MVTVLGANSVTGGFDVANSARFDQPDGADSLRWNSGANGNMILWTVSMWIKRSKFGAEQTVWKWGSNASAEGGIYFDANDQLVFINDSQNGGSNEVDGVFRDPSAWYHVVWACDTAQSSNANRWKVYINGVQRTLTGGPTISQANGQINQGATHQNWIGDSPRSLQTGTSSSFFSGYIAEVVFIDGAALAPTSFGEFDDSGIWKPIESVADLTFGTYGYYLNFQNAAELGTDVSGESNTFSESNISDVHQTEDTPTNNFATMNPLNVPAANGPVFSNGNLNLDSAANGNKFHGSSTIGVSSGKWYMEFKPKSGVYSFLGITGDPAEDARNTVNPGYSVSSWGYYQADDGGAAARVANDNSTGNVGGSWEGYAVNDIIGIALNLDTLQSGLNKLYFSKNGVWQNGTDPEDFTSVTGVVGITPPASVPAGAYFFVMGDAAADSSSKAIANFGNPDYANSSSVADGNGFGDFEYAVPSGFLSLCTKNLTETG